METPQLSKQYLKPARHQPTAQPETNSSLPNCVNIRVKFQESDLLCCRCRGTLRRRRVGGRSRRRRHHLHKMYYITCTLCALLTAAAAAEGMLDDYHRALTPSC